MTNPMESELIRLRALEPEDVGILYRWENDTEIWKVSNTRSEERRVGKECS